MIQEPIGHTDPNKHSPSNNTLVALYNSLVSRFILSTCPSKTESIVGQ